MVKDFQGIQARPGLGCWHVVHLCRCAWGHLQPWRTRQRRAPAACRCAWLLRGQWLLLSKPPRVPSPPPPPLLQEATNNAAARGYFMDGGAIIAGYNGKILAGPVFSNIKASVDKAKEGCPSDPAYVGLYGDHEPCKFIEVPGYDADEEFILAAPVSRGDILAAKTYQVGAAPCMARWLPTHASRRALSCLVAAQCGPCAHGTPAPTLLQDNVGNYARTDIWEVLWHNKRRSYMTADAPAGNGLKPEEESLGVGLKPEEGKGGAKADAPAPKDA